MLQELTCDVLMPACSAALCGLERIVCGFCMAQADIPMSEWDMQKPQTVRYIPYERYGNMPMPQERRPLHTIPAENAQAGHRVRPAQPKNRSRHFSSPCSGYGRSVSVPLPTVPSAALSSFTFPSTMVSSPVMSLTRSSTTSLVSLPISSRRPSPSTSVWS